MPGEIVLIVEDNAIVALALQRALARLGYKLLDPVDSGEEAIAIAAAQRPDLILMDVGLAGSLDGVSAAEIIQARAPVPVIYLTGNTQDARLKEAPRLSKPVLEKKLILMMEHILRPAGGSGSTQSA